MASSSDVKLSASDELKLIKSHHHLLSTPNVVSLSYCDEKINGKKTGKSALHVGVIKKLKPEEIKKPDVLVPKSVVFETEGKKKVKICIKVVEEGEIKALGAPYKGGSGIYTKDVQLEGTLGVNTQYKGKYSLLSAAHVLTAFDSSNVGKAIFAQSDSSEHWADTGAVVTGDVPVVLYSSPNQQNPVRAKQDLAWANINNQQGSPEIEKIGAVGGIRNPVKNEKVKIYVRTTDELLTGLTVADVSCSTKIKFEHNSTTNYAFFEEVAKIDLQQSEFVYPGDSGSAVIAESDNSIVGILFSANLIITSAAYFCKLTF